MVAVVRTMPGRRHRLLFVAGPASLNINLGSSASGRPHVVDVGLDIGKADLYFCEQLSWSVDRHKVHHLLSEFFDHHLYPVQA